MDLYGYWKVLWRVGFVDGSDIEYVIDEDKSFRHYVMCLTWLCDKYFDLVNNVELGFKGAACGEYRGLHWGKSWDKVE